jgi:hypothetical protein|tara:strand:+ start:404 stop:853 length:450 start_codon:yes stop_codon:yes gene_type:complete
MSGYFEVVAVEFDRIVLDPVSAPSGKKRWQFWRRDRRRLWVLEYDVQVRVTLDVAERVNQSLDFVIERGFRTDLASIPRICWLVLSPLDVGMLDSAVIHDKGYADKVAPRAVVDEIFHFVMRDYQLKWWKAALAYWAVRLFGKPHYGGP